MNAEQKACSRCGQPVRRDFLGGACSACLFEEAAGAFSFESASAAAAPAAQWVGDYELLEEIGRGGMGVIYKARQHGLDRIVAVKMLLAGEFADVSARQRLIREAKVAARLTHPGIVTIHEVGEDSGRPFFAMEYVAGQNLSQMTRETLLPVATAARFVEQLARAVHYAHENGIVHRDIKPANIIVTLDDEPKLTDFGLTKLSRELSLTLESAGSPNFMAPEQADSKRGRTGPCTDIFGLGAILYYLLTGRPPFGGESLSETLRAVLDEDPVPPRTVRPALPRDLETICLKCLDKDPARRYGSALEAAEEIARWRAHKPILARPASPLERSLKWAHRRPLVAGLTAAVIITLIAGIALSSWEWRRAELQREDALRQAYAADIQSASRVFADHNLGRARQILERTRPAPGQPDLRGWEWRYLWQFCRGDSAALICQRSDVIFSLVPDPLGRWIAAGEAMGGLTLWDPRSGQKLYETAEPINRFTRNPTPEGNRVRTRVASIPGTPLLLYSSSLDGTNTAVNLWNPESRRVEKSLPQPSLVRDLAVTRDGRRALVTTFSPSGMALLWDLQSGKEMMRWSVSFPDFSVGNPLALSPDGRFATFDEESRLRVFDLETGRDRWTFPLLDLYAGACAFSPDGHWLAAGNGYSNPAIQVWNLDTGTEAFRLQAHQGWVRSLLFTRDGRKLISGGADQVIVIWDFAAHKPLRTLRGHDTEVSSLALSADERTLYSGDKSGEVMSWSLDPLPPQNRGAHRIPLPVARWSFLPEGADLLLTSTNHSVFRVRVPDFDHLEPVEAAGHDCLGAHCFRKRQQYFVLHENGDVTIREIKDNALITSWHLAEGPFLAFGVVPQTDDIIAVTDSLEARVADARGNIVFKFKVPDWGFYRTLSADGRELWIVSYDGAVSITGLYTGETRQARLDQGNSVAVAFSTEDPGLIATCSDTGFVRLVSRQTLATRAVLGRYRLSVWSACFAPGERLATVGNGDEDLKLWDLRTGRELLTLTSDQTHGNPVLVSPDGSTFVQYGVPEGDLFIWRAPSWNEIAAAETAGSAATSFR